MARLGTAWIDVEGDFSKLHRQAAAASQRISRGGFKVKADVDRSSIRGVDRLGKSLVAARKDSEGLNNTLLRTKLVAGGLAVIPAAQGLSALAGGAVAATAALGPLAGSLAALPTLLGTAAQGVGTLRLATAGIGDTLKAAMADQDAAATGATTSLKQAGQAAEQVRSAELALSDAHRQVRFAQEGLTDARGEATQQIEDMRAAVARASGDEEGAVLSLRSAREELRKTNRDPRATRLQIDEANYRVRQAQQELRDTRKAGRDAREDLAKAERQGVRNMPQVVAARRGLADANRSVAEAARSVDQAQKAMADSGAEATSTASKLSVEMAKLSPEARAFARQLIGLQPELKRLRAAAGRNLFPGLGEGLTSAQRNLPVLEQLLERTGGAFGDVARDAGALVGSPAFGRDLAIIGERNAKWTEQLGRGTVDLLSALRHLMVASGPFVGWLVKTAEGWAKGREEAAKMGRETGTTARYLERTRAIMERLWSIGDRLAGAFAAIGRAARPLGDDIWRSIDRGARRFEEWAESARGQNSLRDWFANARATGRDFFGFIGDLMGRFRELRDSGRSTADSLTIVFGEGVARALSYAAEQAARHAPVVAEAFVRGFLAANVWGRLLVGGWLLKRMGGLAAFRGLGTRAGAATGVGMAAGMAPAVATSGLKGRMVGMFRSWGPALGIGLAATLGPELLKGLDRAANSRTSTGLPSSGGINSRLARHLKRGFDPSKLTTGFEVFKGGLKGGPKGALKEMSEALDLNDEKMRVWAESADRSFRRFRAAQDGAGMQAVARTVRTLSARLDGPGREAFQRWADTAENAGRRIERIQANFARLRKGTEISMSQILGNTTQSMRLIYRTMDVNSEGGRRAVSKNFRLGLRAIERSMDGGQFSTRTAMRGIERLMRTHSAGGKEAMKTNLAATQRFIARTMRDSGGITKQGLAYIERLFTKELRLYGFSKKQALNIQGGQRYDAGPNEGTAQGAMARGGIVQFGQPGAGGRDNIPVDFGGRKIMVGAGEQGVVFNRHQLPILDAKLADDGGLRGFFKKHDKPNYMARGGYVQGAVPPQGAGSEPIRAFAEEMFKRGFSVTSGGEYRGSGTFHDQQRALDWGDSENNLSQFWSVVKPQRNRFEELFGPAAISGLYNRGQKFSDGELQAAHEDHFHTALLSALSGALGNAVGGVGAGLARQMGKVGRVLVEGPDSPLKSIVQASIDATRAGANKRLQEIAGSTGGGGPDGSFGGITGGGSAAQNRLLGQKMAQAYAGWGRGPQWSALDHLWGVDESGWDEGVANFAGSGAYGIAQALPASKYPPAGQPGAPNGPEKAKAQIGWGLQYVKDRYGTPIAADNFRHSAGWYARGGPVGYVRGRYPERLSPVRGRFPSRQQVTGQRRDTLASKRRYQELRDEEDPKKKKAREKLDVSREAAKKDLGRNRRKLARMRKNRRTGLARQEGRQGRYASILAGLDLPEGMIDQFDSRAFALEDHESLLSLADDRYRADELVTTDTLRDLLGPGLNGLTPDDLKDLVGSTESVLTQPELNDLLGRSAGLKVGYEGQQTLAQGVVGTLNDRIPKVREMVAEMSKRVRKNMRELTRAVERIKVLRGKLRNKTDRLDTVDKALEKLAKKKKPTKQERETMLRLAPEAARLRGVEIPEVQGQLSGLGARVPVLEADNRFLTGVGRPQSTSGDSTEGLIGEAREMLTGSPGLLDSLATFKGELRPGGLPASIQAAQLSIDALRLEGATTFAPSDPAGDTETGVVDDGGRADLGAQLLREMTQRFAVSQAQYGVLRDFPYAGQFHTGGVVPGPPQQERMALVRGQETIRTVEQEATLQSGALPDLKLIVHGDIISDRRDPVEAVLGDKRFPVAVERATRTTARSAGRGLPSRGGGGF